MMHHRIAALVLLALVAGCSATSSRSTTAAGVSSSKDSQRLVLAEVTDIAALVQALAAERFMRAGTDTALTSIAYDSTGALGAVRFLHPGASEEEAERIESRFRERLAPAALPKTSAWLMLVRGDTPRVLSFEPTGEKAPRMLNTDELARGLRALTAQPEMRNREAGVWVFVSMKGDVQQAKVVQTSGSIKADQALLELAKRARFSPARMDRFPVPAWVQFPLSIR